MFDVGFHGLMRQIDGRLSTAEAEQRDFLEALRMVAEGYLDLCNRYAGHAAALAEAEPDPQRRAELERIAGHCRHVPAEPPTSFWEACQCAWSCFLFVPDAPGRVDQYLGRFYEQDIAAGTLTRESAKELLGCLWIKYFEVVGAASGVSAINHLTLGGTLPDGSDGSNEVTRLCLEVVAETRLLRPQVGLRWHRGTPPEVLRCAVVTLRAGSGNPDFCSDEQIVPALTRLGVSLEDARDFSLSGCHEVIVTGKAQMGSVEGFINLPMVLRMSLGLEPELAEPGTLADLADAGAFYQRLLASLARVAEMAHLASLQRDRQAAEVPGGELTASLVTRDCIENGRGYTQGGARYNFCNWDVIGLANLADSLAALNQLVFEDEALSLSEMASVFAADWGGHEPLRQRVLNRTSRFGNDDSAVDAIAARLLADLERLFQGWTPFRGGRYILGTTAGGENMHIEFGRATGATPDGRRAGEPLADSVGAAQGRDRRGVTALLTSVASLPHRLL
ncbi:MAG: hypothetical protein HYU66_13100, partial [Armatimonadetes bacterium]|nr:hypothetical protein [Armatimonadota bacterium]